MTSYELLNNVKHKDLRVLTEYGPHLGDNVASAPTYITEFRDVVVEYPILIQKSSETGEFQTVVLFGFEKGENLFLNGEDWNADFIPSYVKRGPFLIGFQKRETDGGQGPSPMVHVDMNNPRISKSKDEGTPVFLEHGGNSEYLERINLALSAIYTGVEPNRHMLATFGKLGLIEPFNINLKLNNGAVNQLSGFYTLHEEKLAALGEADIVDLHKKRFLEPAYLIIASLVNMKKLLRLKNIRMGL
jgi:hypothetical protein